MLHFRWATLRSHLDTSSTCNCNETSTQLLILVFSHIYPNFTPFWSCCQLDNIAIIFAKFSRTSSFWIWASEAGSFHVETEDLKYRTITSKCSDHCSNYFEIIWCRSMTTRLLMSLHELGVTTRQLMSLHELAETALQSTEYRLHLLQSTALGLNVSKFQSGHLIMQKAQLP